MIIFLYGDDTYRSLEKLKEIKNKFITDVDKSGLNLDILEGKDLTIENFAKAAKSVPFLARRRLIIIKNLLTEVKNADLFEGIFSILKSMEKEDIVENDNIVVFYEQGNKLGNYKLARYLKERNFTHNFDQLQGFALNKWIKQEVKNRGGKIDEDAVKEMASLVGNNLWFMHQEIDKLIAYKNGEKICQADIPRLVAGKFDDNIFNLVDALGNKNKKLALKLINEQLRNGANEIYLLTMLVRQFRILIQVKEMALLGFTKKDISQKLKIHPFVVQKALGQSKNYSFQDIKKIYRQFLDMDMKLKSGFIKEKARVLFDLFVSRI